ncbi:MAG TPA: aromatic amino acid transport family protein [Gammaproteobacteria bacterium]|nr:aromatic amino acid transport family protein [Gammaproteobacteria bacterium]
MNSKLLGSILLIIGTSIGAAMLGLPIAAAELGFVGSLILLLVCWFIMIAGAFLILEVNLWLPQNSNLISMAKSTIGPLGQIIAWITYLLLFYSLLCAYIAGGSDLFHNLLQAAGLKIPAWTTAVLFTLIFSSIVFLGIRSVDWANRVLMLTKFSVFFVLIFMLIFSISPDKLLQGNLHHLTSISAIMVTATSFGWATLIPSLRVYFAGDLKKLKLAMIIGSIIPLICYIIWDAVIMGIIPLTGENSLVFILHSANSTSDLVNILSSSVNKNSVIFSVKLFTSICVLTSFLGVSLCLTDFFADGFHLEKKGKNRLILHAITFIPALGIAIIFPHAFIKALAYAGMYCVILLILLPAWMAWCGRYHQNKQSQFKVPGGKIFLSMLMVFSLILIVKFCV